MTTLCPCHSAAIELGRRRYLQSSDHRDGCSGQFGHRVFVVLSCNDIQKLRANQRTKGWSPLLAVSSAMTRGRRRLSVASGFGHCEVCDVGRAKFEAEHRQGPGSRIGKNLGQEDLSKIFDLDDVAIDDL